jgi:phosphoglycolate phosphatase-like HAD superfamily hydrolase
MIGDSDVDHAAAEAARVPFRLLDHGYAPEDWDTTRLVRHATFLDLVESLKLEQPPIPPLYKAA